jgi:hypothetical protein
MCSSSAPVRARSTCSIIRHTKEDVGIAGLSAGVMLREFADVTVRPSLRSLFIHAHAYPTQILEAAPEMKEVGAAVTIGPGVVAILRRYGLHFEQHGGVVIKELRIWQSDGALLAQHAFNAKERAGEEIVRVLATTDGCVLTSGRSASTARTCRRRYSPRPRLPMGLVCRASSC